MDYGQKLLFDQLYKKGYNMYDIQIGVDSLHNRDFVIYKGCVALRVTSDNLFDWGKVYAFLGIEKPIQNMQCLYSDSTFSYCSMYKMEPNDKYKLVYCFRSGECDGTAYMSKENYDILTKYMKSIPYQGSLMCDFDKNIFVYMIDEQIYAIVLGCC